MGAEGLGRTLGLNQVGKGAGDHCHSTPPGLVNTAGHMPSQKATRRYKSSSFGYLYRTKTLAQAFPGVLARNRINVMIVARSLPCVKLEEVLKRKG